MPRKPAPQAQMMDTEPGITRTSKRGRPSNAQREEAAVEEARAAAPTKRMAPRPVRQTEREPTRQPARQGGVMVVGRDGEQLTRRRTSVGDVHHVPANEIPQGWDYQWNVVTVANQEFREEQQVMAQNGWRPVPSSRHAGRWTEPGYNGAIIVKGLRLEERPSQLGAEARAEDIARARDQVRTQTESLRLSKKLPDGMAIGNKYRGTGADVRMKIDAGLDIPAPSHELAGDE